MEKGTLQALAEELLSYSMPLSNTLAATVDSEKIHSLWHDWLQGDEPSFLSDVSAECFWYAFAFGCCVLIAFVFVVLAFIWSWAICEGNQPEFQWSEQVNGSTSRASPNWRIFCLGTITTIIVLTSLLFAGCLWLFHRDWTTPTSSTNARVELISNDDSNSLEHYRLSQATLVSSYFYQSRHESFYSNILTGLLMMSNLSSNIQMTIDTNLFVRSLLVDVLGQNIITAVLEANTVENKLNHANTALHETLTYLSMLQNVTRDLRSSGALTCQACDEISRSADNISATISQVATSTAETYNYINEQLASRLKSIYSFEDVHSKFLENWPVYCLDSATTMNNRVRRFSQFLEVNQQIFERVEMALTSTVYFVTAVLILSSVTLSGLLTFQTVYPNLRKKSSLLFLRAYTGCATTYLILGSPIMIFAALLWILSLIQSESCKFVLSEIDETKVMLPHSLNKSSLWWITYDKDHNCFWVVRPRTCSRIHHVDAHRFTGPLTSTYLNTYLQTALRKNGPWVPPPQNLPNRAQQLINEYLSKTYKQFNLSTNPYIKYLEFNPRINIGGTEHQQETFETWKAAILNSTSLLLKLHNAFLLLQEFTSFSYPDIEKIFNPAIEQYLQWLNGLLPCRSIADSSYFIINACNTTTIVQTLWFLWQIVMVAYLAFALLLFTGVSFPMPKLLRRQPPPTLRYVPIPNDVKFYSNYLPAIIDNNFATLNNVSRHSQNRTMRSCLSQRSSVADRINNRSVKFEFSRSLPRRTVNVNSAAKLGRLNATTNNTTTTYSVHKSMNCATYVVTNNYNILPDLNLSSQIYATTEMPIPASATVSISR